jgi:hypothetical protein
MVSVTLKEAEGDKNSPGDALPLCRRSASIDMLRLIWMFILLIIINTTSSGEAA